MKIGKKLILASALAAAAFSVSACGKKETIKVGILQYVSHDALDKATEGFKEQIQKAADAKGKNVEFVVKNPQADETTILTMATSLVRECDLVMGNATPAATKLVAAAETENKSDLPILFTSVTDPVDAKLVTSFENPGGNVTGTSDINPVSKQMDLAIDLKGNTCTVGFLYTASETNSEVQCNEAKAYLQQTYPNVKVETMTIPDSASISSVTTSLSSKADVIYLPTDNLVASNMTTVSNVTNEAKVPLICGESSMVNNGGTLSISISYYELGKTTGDMAVDILFNGKKPNEIAVQSQTDVSKYEFTKNDDALRTMNITLSNDFKSKYGLN